MIYTKDLKIFPDSYPITREFPHGTFTLVTGNNGAGKTTLLRVLAGGKKPFSGHVHTVTPVSYLSHSLGLYSGLTVEENLDFFSHINSFNVTESIKHWGLVNIRQRPIRGLSKGQQLRVALAKHLSVSCSTLLLDEPTANLDDQYKELFLNELLRIRGQRAIIVATHDSSFFSSIVGNDVFNLAV